MEKSTFLKATAKVQREYMFDEILEIKKHVTTLKQRLHISAFVGGFIAVFTACGGYAVINYFKLLGA